jgi:hypothetical protein
MISAATQSTAKTIPGKRYVLGIINLTQTVTVPDVLYSTPSGQLATPLTGENTTDAHTWAESEIKYITFTAWGDGIRVNSASDFFLWRLTPVSS